MKKMQEEGNNEAREENIMSKEREIEGDSMDCN